MKTARNRSFWLAAALGIVVMAGGSAAHAIDVDLADAVPGVVGDTVLVAIDTEDLTGLGVYAYDFALTHTPNTATFLGVVDAGTLTGAAAWAAPVVATVGTNEVRVAAAGSVPLASSGTLLFLRFALGPSSGTSFLAWQDFTYNEGAPAVTLSNGSISVSAAPTITASPSTAELVVGDSFDFNAFGGTAPYVWSVTDGSVASIDAAGLLTGLSFGSTRVVAEDAAGTVDTTGVVEVRALSLSLPTGATAAAGASVTIPVTVSDVTGLGIRSFEFDLDWNELQLEVVAVDLTGTLAAAWGTAEATISPGHLRCAAAGSSPLAGAGVVANLECVVPIGASSQTTLALSDSRCDERYVPLEIDGTFLVNVPPVINASLGVTKLLAGESRSVSVSGAVTPPLTYGVTDSSVATIDGAGLLTAVAGGEVRAFVADAAGARDTTAVVQLFDLAVTIPSRGVPSSGVVPIPVELDRDVAPLDIYGYEFTLTFNASRVRAVSATDSGSVSATWGPPVVEVGPGRITVAHAGAVPLAGSGTLVFVYFEADSAAADGEASAVSFDSIVFNEGSPRACPEGGTLTVSSVVGVGTRPGPDIALAQNRPNPFRAETTIGFTVARGARVQELRVVDAAGRLVRRFDLAGYAAGPHAIRWDGRNEGGGEVASGVYFYRLSGDGRTDQRRMVKLR